MMEHLGGEGSTHHRVVVVGAGFGGIAAAIRLGQAGYDDVLVLEKAEKVGGTWRDNTYPGCGCDVVSVVYSLSFAPNPNWTRVFARQEEIQAYLEQVARDFGVLPRIRFRVEMLDCRWDQSSQRWEVQTTAGVFTANVLIVASGPLHRPRLPDVRGLATFQGTAFHSSRWNHDHSLAGRRVAVIGSGASTVQFLPEIQPQVQRLYLFQRTPQWILPKPDRPLEPWERWVLRNVPGVRRLVREVCYGLMELIQLALRRPGRMKHWHWLGLKNVARVTDPQLRAKVTPDFTLGCKRILLSSDYYQALNSDNVEVLATALAEVRPRSVVGANGEEREVDTIIFGTGFQVTDMPIAERIRATDDRTLAERWNGSPEAYLGTTVAGAPNLFLLIGPNLGNGHTSALVLIEAQLDYIVGALETMDRHDVSSIEIRKDACDAYNASVQSALIGTVWNAGGCASYYLDRNGRNSTVYPWTTIDLRRRCRRFSLEPYHVLHNPTHRRSSGSEPLTPCGEPAR